MEQKITKTKNSKQVSHRHNIQTRFIITIELKKKHNV